MPASDRWQSNAGHGCPAPRHNGLHAIINFIGLSAILAEIGPIEQTMNSYQNHEFIPPGRKTRLSCYVKLLTLTIFMHLERWNQNDEATYSFVKARTKRKAFSSMHGPGGSNINKNNHYPPPLHTIHFIR